MLSELPFLTGKWYAIPSYVYCFGTTCEVWKVVYETMLAILLLLQFSRGGCLSQSASDLPGILSVFVWHFAHCETVYLIHLFIYLITRQRV
jgi:hypothetical protein